MAEPRPRPAAPPDSGGRPESFPTLRFRSLAALPWLRHAVLTRRGPGGREWTFSFSSGDPDPSRVAEDLRTVERELGIAPIALVGQVHGTETLFLPPGSAYAPKSPGEVAGGYDAVASGPGRSPMIRVADCQAVILADPRTRTVAVVHSGWRGSEADVLGKTVSALKARIGVDPADLLAGIGPSLGPCCAEFINHLTELPDSFRLFPADKPDHFDFWAISRSQLAAAGVPEANVEVMGICTKCHPDFYSHRRGDLGRFAVVAAALP